MTSRYPAQWAKDQPSDQDSYARATMSSSAWIWGIIREIGEGPITHLMMLVTPKSMNKVRRSSNALSRKRRAKVILSTLLSMKAGVASTLARAVELKAFLSCQAVVPFIASWWSCTERHYVGPAGQPWIQYLLRPVLQRLRSKPVRLQ